MMDKDQENNNNYNKTVEDNSLDEPNQILAKISKKEWIDMKPK
jgi:hypothetical protein